MRISARQLCVAACLCATPVLPAVTIGQTDTFEDGTTQGWVINLLGRGGSVTGPANVATGGPRGAGDNYLLLTSSGTGTAGGRLVAINPAQWAGDYLAAGIAAIRMDVRNFGANDAYMRLMFEDAMGAPPENVAISTEAVFVPAGGAWTSIVLPVNPGSLTALEGTVAGALSNTTILRIFSGKEAAFPPEPLALRIGIDNVNAVPEPATVTLLACGLLACAVRGRRRRSLP